MPYATVNTPFGALTVFEEDDALVALEWGAAPERCRKDTPTPLLRRTCRQLDDYFDGRRQTFDLPLRPAGTAYQQRVWARLREIPYGRTESYGAPVAPSWGPHRGRWPERAPPIRCPS